MPGGAGEVVSRPATRTPHPTRTGGQDDGSYTNSLKKGQCAICLAFFLAASGNLFCNYLKQVVASKHASGNLCVFCFDAAQFVLLFLMVASTCVLLSSVHHIFCDFSPIMCLESYDLIAHCNSKKSAAQQSEHKLQATACPCFLHRHQEN